MKICIFPGTFNPIHNAHIRMAEVVCEKYKFDKIIFIPSYLPPHKEIDKDLTAHRFNMVKLAIEGNEKFEASGIEYQSEGKSYSLITVKKIIEQYDIKGRLNFIIGADAFVNLNNWYKADELKELVHFIVFPRRGNGNDEIYNGFRKKGWDFELVNSEFMDISSTEIRDSYKHDVSKKVEEYIEKYGLYKY